MFWKKRPVAVPRSAVARIRRKAHRKLYRRMYWWRAACAGVVLLLLPFARIGLGVVVMHTTVMARYVDCRSTKFGRLWLCDAGDDRERWTEPLNGREQGIWKTVVTDARKHGFVFREPVPVHTTVEADSFQRPLPGKIYGRAFWSGRILLSSQDMTAMSDEEVALLMAHELGHHIDFQNERMRHPVLNRLANADEETVAWGVAAELYGGEAVGRFQEKWQHPRDWLG